MTNEMWLKNFAKDNPLANDCIRKDERNNLIDDILLQLYELERECDYMNESASAYNYCLSEVCDIIEGFRK